MGLVRRDRCDTFLPQPDVGVRGLEEGVRERPIVLPRGDPELDQRIVGAGLDLRRQHPRSRPPGLAMIAAGLEQSYPSSGQRQLAGAGGSNRAGTNYDNIVRCGHLYFL